MAETKKQDLVYEAGWLDAYARRPPQPRAVKRYREGFAAGRKSREQQDRNKPKLDAVAADTRAHKGVQDD